MKQYFPMLLLAFAGCQPSSHDSAGMAYIPGGEFTMGTDSDRSYVNERPAHRVKVSPLYLDVNPVTKDRKSVV